MDKRWSAVLLVSLSIALLGLVVIQVVWIRSTVSLKEAQFAQSVNNALFAVSERVERVERVGRLKEHPAGRQLLFRLDSLRTVQDSAPSEWANDPSASGSGAIAPGEPWPLLQDSLFDPGEHEALVADVVRGLLYRDTELDLRERMDTRMLDSLLTAEFITNELPTVFSYGVFSKQGRPVLVPKEPEDTVRLAASPFKERLFHHDLSGQIYVLHVVFPDQHTSLLRGTLPMLAVSALFIAIIVLAFVHTLRTIRRQKRLSDIRTDLVNNLTHELKTPISTIGLACEALSDTSMPKTDQQVRTYVSMIREENKRLGALVENVLQSALEARGHMVIKAVDLDLHKLIQEVVRGSSMQVSRRDGRIELDLKAEIHQVQGDRIHLTNLLYNLIDNAMKYTEQEPRIRISTQSNDEGITVSIADNGVGIPLSEQRKIFERLYRVPTGNIHNAKGFGLGLSYVKAVVERHGGRIKLNSAPGAGSTFHIFIPFEHVGSEQITGR